MFQLHLEEPRWRWERAGRQSCPAPGGRSCPPRRPAPSRWAGSQRCSSDHTPPDGGEQMWSWLISFCTKTAVWSQFKLQLSKKYQNQNSKFDFFDFFMYKYACPTFVLKLYNISCILGSHVVWLDVITGYWMVLNRYVCTCCAWEKDGAVVGTRMFLPASASCPCRPAPHRYTSHFPPRCQSCKKRPKIKPI